MATALSRIAIAWFGQFSIRPQRALCVKAPEDASADLLRVGIWFGLEEHVFGAQSRAEIRTIRIQIVKFSHYNLRGFRFQVSGFRFQVPEEKWQP
jgi:hypothetical protein